MGELIEEKADTRLPWEAGSKRPLPLIRLQHWFPKSIFAWLLEYDEAKQKLKLEMENENYGVSLFQDYSNGVRVDDDDSERVQMWAPSLDSPGGIFLLDDSKTSPDSVRTSKDEQRRRMEINFVLSSSSHGHGSTVWPAARCIANVLADPESCCEALSWKVTSAQNKTDESIHPLHGRYFLELGAGAGLPSWVAMKCGAITVATDQKVEDRIICMAESMERNFWDLRLEANMIHNARQCRVIPYDWGDSVAEVLAEVKPAVLFDVIVAADCCYMPHLHAKLLTSIWRMLATDGVALLPFALHGNTRDKDVWSIVDRANELGFVVEKLEPKQLQPDQIGFDTKRAFVHTLRLRKSELKRGIL